MIDVDRILHSAVAIDGDQSKERNFTISAGQVSSALENGIFEQLYQAEGVSTVKLLKLASDQGIPIYTIDQNNISAVLPKLSIPADVVTDIQNSVNAGKSVTVSAQSINYYGWIGVGYIVMDPLTGSGAYMISVNFAGGGQCVVAAGGVAHECLLIGLDIWHYADTITAIILIPNLLVAILYLSISEFGAAAVLGGLATALGLSLVAIIAGAILALLVIYLIKLVIDKYNTAEVATSRSLYAAKRRVIWTS